MFAFAKLQRLKISAKLSSVVGTALLALCVMGAIAVFAAREIQYLGHDLYAGNKQFLSMQLDVAVGVERAIADVHAAPSELDLGKLKAKREHFEAVLNEAKKVLKEGLPADATNDVKASSAEIASAIDAFGNESKKVFDFAASFAQPDAIAALSSTVAPAESAVQAEIKQFQNVVAKTNSAKTAVIQRMTKTITWIVVGLAVSLVAGIAVFAYVIVSRVTRPLNNLASGLLQLADGNLDVRVPGLDRKDEIGQIANAVQMVVDKVGSIVSNIKTAANDVTNSSIEISTSTTDLSQRTEEQAASLEETSASMEEISATVKKNAENAQRANEFAAETNMVAERGGAVVNEAVNAMARIEESSRKISDIIGVIDEIARQTNLLALNAAVEAARAGEAGRGFSVVASEVRTLAQRSSQAAKDIKGLITNSNSQVKDGVDLVNKAGKSLNEIVASIKKVAEIIGDITNASMEQSTGLDQINKALARMDEVTQQNSALVEENAATAKTLEHQAKAMVALFRGSNAGEVQDAPRAKEPAVKTAPKAKAAASAPKAPAASQHQPVVALKQVAAGNNGGPVRRMQTAVATAANADPEWKEF